MKRDPEHQLSARETYEQLSIPTGEFFALFVAALMMLGLVFGFSDVLDTAKSIVVNAVAALAL